MNEAVKKWITQDMDDEMHVTRMILQKSHRIAIKKSFEDSRLLRSALYPGESIVICRTVDCGLYRYFRVLLVDLLPAWLKIDILDGDK